MAALENDIKRVSDKLQQLLKQYQLLQKENEKLSAALKKCQAENDQHRQQTEQLLLQVNILKSAAGNMTEADKKAFEKKLNQYSREIDKCIALLSE